MNPSQKPEITVETLLALRTQENAAQLIAEKLRVKEMGPADHIRTKHEVKAFVDLGGLKLAEGLTQQTQERIFASQKASRTMSERVQQDRRMAP